METIIEKLKEILEPDQIIENADMSRHTSFKAGGCADLLVCPSDAEQLQKGCSATGPMCWCATAATEG